MQNGCYTEALASVCLPTCLFFITKMGLPHLCEYFNYMTNFPKHSTTQRFKYGPCPVIFII